MIETLQSYLESKIPSQVYVGIIPATSGVIITPYPSRESAPQHPYDYMNIQVRTKEITYPLAESVARQCYSALQNLGYVFDIIQCVAKQEPYYLKTDEQGYTHFAQNYEIEYYNRNRLTT